MIVMVLLLPRGLAGGFQLLKSTYDVRSRARVEVEMEPVLVLDSVEKAFGGLRVTSDVSFSVAPGSISAIIGPNGAGKTTLFNEITGYLVPDKGRIVFQGEDITRSACSRNRLTRHGTGFPGHLVLSGGDGPGQCALGVSVKVEPDTKDFHEYFPVQGSHRQGLQHPGKSGTSRRIRIGRHSSWPTAIRSFST